MTTLADVTAADFKARYPAFAGVADPTVTAILDEARGSVDDAWIEKDQRPALLALAAHLLIGAGALGADGVESGYSAAGMPLAALRAGDTEIKFSGSSGSRGSSGQSAKGYAATTYGQRYVELRNRSFPAVLVV